MLLRTKENGKNVYKKYIAYYTEKMYNFYIFTKAAG